ncbi:MAG: SRPBCC domain-containing protein [Paracoccaceae bacterium]
MAVWGALNDPEVLRVSIPGCSELTGNALDGFEAVVTQKIGPVKATFKGQVGLSDIVEGKSYRISGQGKGGPAGYASGGAAAVEGDAVADTALESPISERSGILKNLLNWLKGLFK